MSKILCIDTATDICSVALAENGVVTAFIDSEKERSHAKMLAVFIDELLKRTSTTIADLDAIGISMGPGSYTGLRIGVSTAKGLCYGANKPLLAISTLKAMCYGIDRHFIENQKDYYYCPMIDARRMEVYTCLYNKEYRNVTEIHALVVDNESLRNYLDEKPILFFGSGSEKLTSVIVHQNALFYNGYNHSSCHMAQIAEEKYSQKQFEDVAYFEPFYLKDFVATVPKKAF